MNMEIIRTKTQLCTCCMEEHAVKLVRMKERTTFKHVPVEYTAEYYFCDAAEEFYMDEEMIRENDMRMKDAYRKLSGLLTSKEISAIRKKYGVTQSDLCALLGWGGKTITRYETHQVQDRAHDAILKKLDEDPEWFLSLVIEAKRVIAPDPYRRYLKLASLLYEENQDAYLRKSIEAKYVRFRDEAKANGNVPLSLDRVVDVIRFFADSADVTKLYKVKLMKLLWYADALAYKLRGRAITGLVYRALPMGAVPIGHESIIDLKGVICEEVEIGDGTAYRFCASGNREYPSLEEGDRKILDKVIGKLGGMTKDEIVSFMHRERAYQETSMWEIISFEYAEALSVE